MIGKPEWFKRRKYGGWGLFPATWHGWAYVAIFVVAMFATQNIPTSDAVRFTALAIIGAVLILDTIDIMAKIKKDERDILHEAIAERNAMWTIIFVLAGGVAYRVGESIVQSGEPSIDPIILIAIFAALAVKAITNYYLDKKD
jgi:hypothetical protein